MSIGDYRLIIDGRLVPGRGTSVPVYDPATGDVFAQAPGCSREQLDEAVAAARGAFPAWSSLPLAERKRLVQSIAGVVNDHFDEFKQLLTREQGKPFETATAELQGAAYWAMAAAGLELPVETRGDTARRVEIRHTPLGVVGAIVPWNYPLLTAMMKIVPALVAGNTVVLKPAPTTPLSTLRLGDLLRGVLPAGVLNVVTGGNELGPWLVAHADVDKISFTGSTATGKKIMQSAVECVKRVTLEMGGNDAAIVLPDVDVDAVAQRLFWGAFLNSGQVCVAAKRIYVHEDIYDRFLAALMAIAKTTRMGAGSEPGVQLGPVQNQAQLERLQRLAGDARAAGLKLLTATQVDSKRGYFFPVTIVDNPPDDSAVVREEAFGPLLPLLKFRDIDEVVERANNTRYGLGGSVWSKDVQAAAAIGERLECGTVWINTIMDAPPDQPMGGHKESGFGVENGQLGLLEYTNVQTRVVVAAA